MKALTVSSTALPTCPCRCVDNAQSRAAKAELADVQQAYQQALTRLRQARRRVAEA